METGADEVCEFGEITIESCKGRDWMEIAASASPVMIVRLLSLHVSALFGRVCSRFVQFITGTPTLQFSSSPFFGINI